MRLDFAAMLAQPTGEKASSDQKRAFKNATSKAYTSDRERAVFGKNDVRDYRTLYGELPFVKKGDNLGRLFANGRATHNAPLVSRGPVEILPRMYSFDREVLEFQRTLQKELNDAIPVSKDDDGFTRTGVHAPFNLCSVAGYLQDPMSYKVVDNTEFRRALGLSDGYSPKQKEIARIVWDEVWRHAVPSVVNVPKFSAGGMRRFSHSPQWKIDYAVWKTHPSNYGRFLTQVEKEDVFGLANDFEIVYGMYIQKRSQIDTVGKVRQANDLEYALSGGTRGRRFDTDSKVVINGVEYPDFIAKRVRVIDAGPWAINCDLQMAATGAMKALFVRYPSTFHINTSSEISAVVNGKYVYCSDVSEYDQSMSKDALAVCFEAMREYWPEGVVRSAERLYASPYFAKPLSIEGGKSLWIHDPMDWSWNMNGGNRSGHAFTSLIAKVNKVIETLIVFSTFMKVDATNVRSFLEGKMPIGTVNNGDDEIVWSADSKLFDAFKKARSDKSKGHYKVEPEDGQGFSGYLLVRPDPSKLEYFPTPKVGTGLQRMYSPERSIGGKIRSHWATGFYARIDSFHESDIGIEVWNIHNDVYRKLLEPKYGPLVSLLAEGASQSEFLGLSAIDAAVLADPEKLHYMFTADEVSPDVLSRVSANIPGEYCYDFFKRYFSGVLV